jgi:hypothetical protein
MSMRACGSCSWVDTTLLSAEKIQGFAASDLICYLMGRGVLSMFTAW